MCVTPDRPRRHGGARADLEFVLQQTVNPRFVHNQQNEVNRLPADLQAEASAADGKVRWRPPRALRAPATDQPFTVLTADDEAAFFDRGKNGDALRAVEQLLRNSLVRSGHNLLKSDGGFLGAYAFIGIGSLARRTLN